MKSLNFYYILLFLLLLLAFCKSNKEVLGNITSSYMHNVENFIEKDGIPEFNESTFSDDTDIPSGISEYSPNLEHNKNKEISLIERKEKDNKKVNKTKKIKKEKKTEKLKKEKKEKKIEKVKKDKKKDKKEKKKRKDKKEKKKKVNKEKKAKSKRKKNQSLNDQELIENLSPLLNLNSQAAIINPLGNSQLPSTFGLGVPMQDQYHPMLDTAGIQKPDYHTYKPILDENTVLVPIKRDKNNHNVYHSPNTEEIYQSSLDNIDHGGIPYKPQNILNPSNFDLAGGEMSAYNNYNPVKTSNKNQIMLNSNSNNESTLNIVNAIKAARFLKILRDERNRKKKIKNKKQKKKSKNNEINKKINKDKRKKKEKEKRKEKIKKKDKKTKKDKKKHKNVEKISIESGKKSKNLYYKFYSQKNNITDTEKLFSFFTNYKDLMFKTKTKAEQKMAEKSVVIMLKKYLQNPKNLESSKSLLRNFLVKTKIMDKNGIDFVNEDEFGENDYSGLNNIHSSVEIDNYLSKSSKDLQDPSYFLDDNSLNNFVPKKATPTQSSTTTTTPTSTTTTPSSTTTTATPSPTTTPISTATSSSSTISQKQSPSPDSSSSNKETNPPKTDSKENSSLKKTTTSSPSVVAKPSEENNKSETTIKRESSVKSSSDSAQSSSDSVTKSNSDKKNSSSSDTSSKIESKKQDTTANNDNISKQTQSPSTSSSKIEESKNEKSSSSSNGSSSSSSSSTTKIDEPKQPKKKRSLSSNSSSENKSSDTKSGEDEDDPDCVCDDNPGPNPNKPGDPSRKPTNSCLCKCDKKLCNGHKCKGKYTCKYGNIHIRRLIKSFMNWVYSDCDGDKEKLRKKKIKQIIKFLKRFYKCEDGEIDIDSKNESFKYLVKWYNRKNGKNPEKTKNFREKLKNFLKKFDKKETVVEKKEIKKEEKKITKAKKKGVILKSNPKCSKKKMKCGNVLKMYIKMYLKCQKHKKKKKCKLNKRSHTNSGFPDLSVLIPSSIKEYLKLHGIKNNNPVIPNTNLVLTNNADLLHQTPKNYVHISAFKEFFDYFVKGFNKVEGKEVRVIKDGKIYSIRENFNAYFTCTNLNEGIDAKYLDDLKYSIKNLNHRDVILTLKNVFHSLQEIVLAIGTRCQGIEHFLDHVYEYLIKSQNCEFTIDFDIIKSREYKQLDKNVFSQAGKTLGYIFGQLKNFSSNFNF